MRYVELFAGIGGFRLGIGKRGQCVYANEWDKYAADTYEHNFGERPDTRDITTVPAGEIPKHDLICGGFPCQAFSIAGKRKGFEETRGTLFFEIMRIARHHRTSYLFLENVKGLLNHDSGRTFETILRTLDESGYDCQWQVLNSKNFGVPQNRERVFIIGHFRGERRPEVFPIGENDRTTDKHRTVVRTLTGGGHSGGLHSQSVAIIAPTIRAEHHNTADVHFVRADESDSRQIQTVTDSDNADWRSAHTISKTVRSGGQKSPHGSKQNWDSYQIGNRIRRLTPTECARLQGFPDNWHRGLSDTQAYKCYGNAVTVNVIEAIMTQWIKGLDKK